MSSDVTVMHDDLDQETEVVQGDVVVARGVEPGGDEEIHMPPPSFAPIILGIGATIALLGIITPLLLPVGLLVSVVGVWKMGHFPQVNFHTTFLPAVNDRKFGMWAFLASEVMFFSSLIGAFIGFKIRTGFTDAEEVLSLPLATVGTSVLIISSFAVVMAFEAIQSDDRRVFRNWMFITLGLGLMFVSIQAFEWTALYRDGLTAKTLFGTTFFLTTGFHGLHVLGGVGWLGMILYRAGRGEYSAQNNLGIELFGLYWHFVDVVWIVLFTVIYLIH